MADCCLCWDQRQQANGQKLPPTNGIRRDSQAVSASTFLPALHLKLSLSSRSITNSPDQIANQN